MSENSSDSESSCGWTIINHEGSDIETINSENGDVCADFASEQRDEFVQELQPAEAEDEPDLYNSEHSASTIGIILQASEESHLASEDVSSYSLSPTAAATLPDELLCQEKRTLAADSVGEAASEDSDIVTLETPRVDDIGPLEDEVADTGDINMSSSSSSQYTFSKPELVFPPQHSADESSSDEASDDSRPTVRQRRSKKLSVSVSESETKAPADHPIASKPRTLGCRGHGLNKCIILALIIAISMGFGHFYGTIQILERQKHVEMIHENELNDMKEDLFQCQMDQVATVEQKAKTDDLSTTFKTDEKKNNLALENQHLRTSLKKGEEVFSLLQDELRKLREQIRNLEEKGNGDVIKSENQKLRTYLKEERQKLRSFLTQKETLLAEAQTLRKELDNERQITESLKVELEEMSNRRAPNINQDTAESSQEFEQMRERLSELEKKLNFEQQRSDLWERLYIEAKEQNEKLESGNPNNSQEKERSKSRGKKKRDTFFNSVKDTFDAMKNSTKAFVRHHKEKIKQAKEAVKENLKKFSDSVKTTFRQFKDSTKNMFDKTHYKKYAERRREETKEAHTVRREYKQDSEDQDASKAAENQNEYGNLKYENSDIKDESAWPNHGKKTNSEQCTYKKGCSGVFECAHQESFSLFNKVLDPVRMEEFNQLIQVYVQDQVDNFRHWKELFQFINRFFHNGVFIHDQMLFTDFVNDVEDYLEHMKEYTTNDSGVFEDLDEFVYGHFFGNAYTTPYGPRKPEKMPPYKDPESPGHRKQEQKPERNHYRREGKWNRHGRANGRHMANVEIDLGQLPFDPKY
ncbi:cell cycle progression 1 [Pelobates cultripes]|uniref:Cell cycle progression 1 n=1 Tax=Pelobates cultripes TaxID=61616 RepID=A0AAD1VUJ3_PELCU|nr:cell cycle progression 1 [Pelobates cultripes]